MKRSVHSASRHAPGRRVGLGLIALAVAASLGAAAAPASARDGIDVISQNQYLGADLTPVLAAATAQPFDPVGFSEAVVGALKIIAANRPAERAQALAALIDRRNPDVAALQEAYAFRCDPYPGYPVLPGRGCDDPLVKGAFTDHLADTLAALGARFRSVGQVTNLKVSGLPFVVNGMPALLSLVDRDAILVRRDLAAAPVDFSALPACRPSDQGCNFWTAPPPFATPLGPIAIERGFVAADVIVKGAPYRLFNTHLEQRLLAPTLPETRLLQVGQAYELLGFALASGGGPAKVIVAGDFNADPADTIPVPPYPPVLPWAPALPTISPYQVFVANGFTDTWLRRPQTDPGLTCCQAETLDNRTPVFTERIDLIFSLTPPRHVLDMRVLGERIGDKTRPAGAPTALWPSDHASVAARLQFD